MTGSDPTYINSMEHFESMRHDEIYAKAQQIDPAQVLHASTIWLDAAGTLTTSFPLTHGGVDRVMDAADWKGAAADAAQACARSFAASADELAAVLGQVGARLGGVAAAAEAVKLAVVPPGASGPVGAIAQLLEAAHVIDAQMAQEALRQEAVLAMNMVYKPAYSTAGSAVPALPAPPAATAPSAPQAVSPGTPRHSAPEQTSPNNQWSPGTTQPAPAAPESPAPSHNSTPPGPKPDPQQTPSAPPTQQAPPPQQAPST
ncbi:hypothetical protein AB0L97_20970, partial [Nocardia sp. NPDC051911]|uniref:hypothetical protein n=1 Tax=Nocardia sp. NPDC051911 TaxID=3154648 RepID=UPI003448A5A3